MYNALILLGNNVAQKHNGPIMKRGEPILPRDRATLEDKGFNLPGKDAAQKHP
jgi:hypothetical protein